MALARKVHFHGHLADTFGKSMFKLHVDSAAAAVRLMEANFPGEAFKAFREGTYHIVLGDPTNDNATYLTEDMLHLGGSQDIHFIPVPQGQGGGGKGSKGIITIIIGVVLIAAAIASAGTLSALTTTYLIGSGATGFLSMSTVAMFGASLVLGGVAQILAPTPQEPDTSIGDYSMADPQTSQQKASFLFNGVMNTEEEGGAVPVLYGRAMCGSIITSGAVFLERLNPNAADTVGIAQIDVG